MMIHDCEWVGAGTIIMALVGGGSIIDAGSVVKKVAYVEVYRRI